MIGASHAFMVSRWENGTALPGPEYREKLCALFEKSARELGFARNVQESAVFDIQAPVIDPAIPFRFSTTPLFVGRDQLLITLQEHLCSQESSQTLALSGLPGVGKTALVAALANTAKVKEFFRDGILWASLGLQANVLAVLSRWGKLLGLSREESGSLRNYDEWAQAIRRLIGERRILLIFDDCWDIVDGLNCKIGGGHCSYILNTRIPEVAVRFAGEQARQVPELSLNDGVSLLTSMAPALVNVESEAIHALVQSVGGLPLALILMGNYLLMQTRHSQQRRTQAALERLQQAEERLKLAQPQAGVDRDPRFPPGTPLCLQTAIHISEARLTEVSRRALAALAVFPAKPDAFSEEAALTVAKIQAQTLDSLVDVGLIEINGDGRYQLHQTIVDYQRTQNPYPQAEERMIDYMVDFAEKHQEHFALLEEELNNIVFAFHLAFQHNQHRQVLRGTLACFKSLFRHGLHPLIERMHKQALESAIALGDKPQQAIVLCNLTNMYKMIGDYKQAEKCAQESLTLLRQHGQEYQTQAEILSHLGHICIHTGDYASASEYLQEGLALARRHQLSKHTCRLLGLLGITNDSQGNIAQAEACWSEGLALARQSGELEPLVYILGSFGAILSEYGRYEEAEAYLLEGLTIARQAENRSEVCHFLLDLGDLSLRRRDLEGAERTFQESLKLARQMNLHPALSAILMKLGELEILRHDEVRAEEYAQEGLLYALEKENRYFISSILTLQGEIRLNLGKVESAQVLFEQALQANPQGNQLLSAVAHYGLARVSLLQGERRRALEQGKESLAVLVQLHNDRAEDVRLWLQQSFASMEV